MQWVRILTCIYFCCFLHCREFQSIRCYMLSTGCDLVPPCHMSTHLPITYSPVSFLLRWTRRPVRLVRSRHGFTQLNGDAAAGAEADDVQPTDAVADHGEPDVPERDVQPRPDETDVTRQFSDAAAPRTKPKRFQHVQQPWVYETGQSRAFTFVCWNIYIVTFSWKRMGRSRFPFVPKTIENIWFQDVGALQVLKLIFVLLSLSSCRIRKHFLRWATPESDRPSNRSNRACRYYRRKCRDSCPGTSYTPDSTYSSSLHICLNPWVHSRYNLNFFSHLNH